MDSLFFCLAWHLLHAAGSLLRKSRQQPLCNPLARWVHSSRFTRARYRDKQRLHLHCYESEAGGRVNLPPAVEPRALAQRAQRLAGIIAGLRAWSEAYRLLQVIGRIGLISHLAVDHPEVILD